MKNITKLFIGLLFLFVFAVPAGAIQKSQNSGLLTSVTGGGTLHTGRGAVTSIVIATDGANDAVFNLYDNTSAAAPHVFPQVTVKAADHIFVLIECVPAGYNTGLHWTLSGTGATATVKYITEN